MLLGNRTGMTTPAGNYAYQYDALNRLSSVQDADGTTSFTYNAVGQIATVARPNGVNTTYTYDARHFLRDITHGSLAAYQYEYDAVGNRTSMFETGGVTTTWQYDEAYRLIEETRSLGPNNIAFSTDYEYDEVGNRLTERHANGDVLRYSYNANDQLTKVEFPNYITDNYSYDTRGNMTAVEHKQGIVSLGISTYSYDARNMLISADVGTSISYEYDYAGRRITQSINDIDTLYLWDEFSAYGDVVRETDGFGAELASYTLADGMLISQTNSVGTSYFLSDALGSTRALTNSAGTITDTFEYDAFGNFPESELPSQPEPATNYLFAGQQYDESLDLYSMRARYYDTALGRFLTRDMYPYNYENPVELNRYIYTANNPVNYTDPSGHDFQSYSKITITTSTVVFGALALLGGASLACVASQACASTILKFFQGIGGAIWELLQGLWSVGATAFESYADFVAQGYSGHCSVTECWAQPEIGTQTIGNTSSSSQTYTQDLNEIISYAQSTIIDRQGVLEYVRELERRLQQSTDCSSRVYRIQTPDVIGQTESGSSHEYVDPSAAPDWMWNPYYVGPQRQRQLGVFWFIFDNPLEVKHWLYTNRTREENYVITAPVDRQFVDFVRAAAIAQRTIHDDPAVGALSGFVPQIADSTRSRIDSAGGVPIQTSFGLPFMWLAPLAMAVCGPVEVVNRETFLNSW